MLSNTDCESSTPELTESSYGGLFLYLAEYELFGEQAALYSSGVEEQDGASILIDDAWCMTAGEEFVRVGIFDSGVFSWHEEFLYDGINSKVDEGYDYYNSSELIEDNLTLAFHGSAASGLIGGIRNNGLGICGVAGGDMKYYEQNDPLELGNLDSSNPSYGVDLFDFKIGEGNTMSADNAVEALWEAALDDETDYVTEAMHLINASFGSLNEVPWPWRTFQTNDDSWILFGEVLKFANRNQMVCAVARGNMANDNAVYPACYNDEWVLSIGASLGTDIEGDEEVGGLAGFSSYGKHVDVIAPGAANFSTAFNLNGPGYNKSFFGTSAATPYVAGISALMIGYHNIDEPHPANLAPEDIEEIIQSTSRDRGTNSDSEVLEYDDETGWGLVTAGAALKKLEAP